MCKNDRSDRGMSEILFRHCNMRLVWNKKQSNSLV